MVAYLNEVKSLVDGGLGIERVSGINLSRDLAGDDLENLLAELDKKTVESIIDLLVDGATLLLSVVNGDIDQLGVLGLLGGSENERRVGGGILRLVLANGYWNVSYCSLYHIMPCHIMTIMTRYVTWAKMQHLVRITGVVGSGRIMRGMYTNRQSHLRVIS
jgi:hypothetical protein